MKIEELQEVQQILLDERINLLQKTRDFKDRHLSYQSTDIQDEVDILNHDIYLNLAIELQERDRLTLMRIDRALAKMKAGQYGICESCGAEIGYRRLKIQPLARLCIQCMTELELERSLTTQ